MKTVKLLVLSVILVFSSTLFAQEKSTTTPEVRAAKMTKNLTEKLSLSDEQVAKIKPLNLEVAKNWDHIKATGAEANKPFLDKMKAKYKAILTTEQYTKFETMAKESLAKTKRNPSGVASPSVKLATKPKIVKTQTINTKALKQVPVQK